MSCGSSSRLVLRMKRPTRVTRGSSLVTSLLAVASDHVDVHRAELQDLDQLVVEAVAALLEEDRAPCCRGGWRARPAPSRAPRAAAARAPSTRSSMFLSDAVPVGQRLVHDAPASARGRCRNRRSSSGAASSSGPRCARRPESVKQRCRICSRRCSAVIGTVTIRRSTPAVAAEGREAARSCRAWHSRRCCRRSVRRSGRRRRRECAAA